MEGHDETDQISGYVTKEYSDCNRWLCSSRKTVSQGLKLAEILNSSITFVTVAEIWSTLGMAAEPYTEMLNPTDNYDEIQVSWANKVLADAADKTKKLGINCETIRMKGHPASRLVFLYLNSNQFIEGPRL